MTTLIAVYKQGKCVGRCDARCYSAKHEDCHCVCGGMNHAQGRTTAENNTYQHITDITRYNLQTYGDSIDVLSKVKAYQLGLGI